MLLDCHFNGPDQRQLNGLGFQPQACTLNLMRLPIHVPGGFPWCHSGRHTRIARNWSEHGGKSGHAEHSRTGPTTTHDAALYLPKPLEVQCLPQWSL